MHAALALPLISFEDLSSCPICGSNTMAQLDPAYHICVCSCGYVCDNPRPTLESIAMLYSAKGKYKKWVNREAPYARLWKRRLRSLTKYSKSGNLLDIGAGTGQFLSIAKPHFTSVSGTEVSTSGAAVAKERYGIQLTVGDIHSMSLQSNCFDNITLFHVLEHVHNPVQMLTRCWDLLTPQGTLFICVPNDILSWGSRIKALGKNIGLPPFQKFSPKFGLPLVGTSSEIYLSHFTIKSLMGAVRKANFSIDAVGLDPYFAASRAAEPFYYLYFAFHWAFFKLTGINHYETILLVARKNG